MSPGFPASPSPDAPAPARPACAAPFGNRCGHDPASPRFHRVSLPEGANRVRPIPITKAIGRVPDYYAAPREGRWDALSQGERHRRLERAITAAGGPDTALGRRLAGRLARWRQQRSERREAVVAALMLLLAYTDVETLVVAVPSGGDWLGLSAPWIAARAGLSLSRTKRALTALDRSGLLATTGRGRRFDARQRRWIGTGWGPVRRFSFRLVRVLGLEVSWDAARRRLRKRARRDADPIIDAPSSAVPLPAAPGVDTTVGRERARALRQSLSGAAARQTGSDPTTRQAVAERARRIAELAAEGLSPAEVRRRLNDAARPP